MYFCIALLSIVFTVTSVIRRYYTVSVFDVGNCNMGKSAAKSRGRCWGISQYLDSGHPACTQSITDHFVIRNDHAVLRTVCTGIGRSTNIILVVIMAKSIAIVLIYM